MKKTKLKAILIFLTISFVGFYNIIDLDSFEEFSLDSKELIQEFDGTKIPKTSQSYLSPFVYKNTTGRAFDVFISGNFAYIANWDDGLAIINISDPMDPGDPIYEDTSSNANGVYVDGNYAFIADRFDGLATINVSDPTNPEAPNYEDTVGEATDVFIDGDYAFIADGDEGLAILNISDPTNPGIPIYENTTGFANAVFVSGNYAFIADRSSGLAIIDISNPTNPGTPIYRSISGDSLGIYVDGDFAYLTNGYGGGLVIIDISDPTNPGTPIYRNTYESAIDVCISGDFAFIADAYGGLAMIDISDPTNPGAPVYEDTITHATAIYIDGNYAYIADDSTGLAIIEISTQITPEEPIYEDASGIADGIYIDGDYAYVADRDSGLAVFNISDPTNPGAPVYESTSGGAKGVCISGNYAYIANDPEGLAVIDITDPSNPGTPIYEPVSSNNYRIHVSGNYAYMAAAYAGLAIINISDPTNPGTPLYESTLGIAIDVFISGNYAYIADLDEGLAIINISNPSNPSSPIYRNTTGRARGVYVSGNYAYLACEDSGLVIIDVSDPTNPGPPVYKDTVGGAQKVYVSGDYAYIADGSGSTLAIIDVSDPTNPGTPIYKGTAWGFDVRVSGEYAYIAAGGNGLGVIKVRDLHTFKPIAVSDLSISENGPTRVTLGWTAPYIDDGVNNTIADYVVKYSISPITEGNFDSAQNFDVSHWNSFSSPGETQICTISGLDPTTQYYYAIKSIDWNNEYSEISNIITQVTNDSQMYQTPVIYEDTFGTANDVYVSGNYAYVADGPNGLMIIDISDPINPRLCATKDTTGNAHDVYISGNYAYVAVGDSGLAVINITDPTHPGDPIYKNVLDYAVDVFISGNYAFIADREEGLAIINVSNPMVLGDPIYKNTTGTAEGIFVDGNYAFIACGAAGLAVIDISNITDPSDPVYRTISGGAIAVYVEGDHAFITNWYVGIGLAIVNISNPLNPGTPIYESSSNQGFGVYVDGDRAYVANGENGIAIFDIKDPTIPRTPIYMDTLGFAFGICIDGDYAYIANGEAGLAILKISERNNSGDQFYMDTSGIAQDVIISGDYAYIADNENGLAIIDISDPNAPGDPFYKDTSGSAQEVYVCGNYAYIADGSSGLAIINISDPTTPGAPIYKDTTGFANGVFISGNYAYIAVNDSGLAVIDISNPNIPGDPIYEPTPGNAMGVYIDGDFAYVANSFSGLAVLNISDPTDPGAPFLEDTDGPALDVFINGDYAYLATGYSGLAVMDISDPTDPGTRIYGPTPTAYDVFVSGDYAYVADLDHSFKIIDVSNPSNPIVLLEGSGIGDARGVYISGEYAYFADGIYGLAVIKISDLNSFKPSQISDLSSSTITNTSVTLSWNAPFIDDGMDNPISSYIVKYSNNPITDGNFDSATNFDTSSWLSLLGPGEIEYRNVTGLNSNTTYYFAIKSIDMEGEYSEISNVINIKTMETETTNGDTPNGDTSNGGDLSLLEMILYGSGGLVVISAVIAIPALRKRKKKKQKKEVGITQEPAEIKTEIKVESKAEAKAKAKAEKSRLSKEKNLKKRGEIENELKSISAQIHEGFYTKAITSLKILEKSVNKNKSLSEFKPEIGKKLKFSENTNQFKNEKDSFWESYKSGEDFMGAYNGISKLKADVEKFPVDYELIHPAIVLEVKEAFQVLKGEYEIRKANILSGISSISNISKPEEILDLDSIFISLEKEANALKMNYILPKINEQHKKYEKNLEIYKEIEDLQLIFNQGDISKANFGITQLNETIEEITKGSGESFIYSTISLRISELSKLVQAEINERNASLYDLNEHYETMLTPKQIGNAKELFGNILNDAEALGIKDLTKKIKHNLNICGISIPFIEEKNKFMQLYSEGQLENAYVGFESLKNRIEVHPRQDLVAPKIKIDIENTYDDIYNEVKNTNAKIFGEIESIESFMNSEQISDAKTRLIQLLNESSQLGFKEVSNKINRMIQVCNISLPIMDDKNRYWTQYTDQNQLIPALDGLQSIVEDIDKGLQSDLILPSIVSDLREKLEFLKNKLDENRKEIEDKLKQISQTIDPDHLSEVIEVMKIQREIAQKLRFDDIDKKISENLIDFEDVSKIYELFKRAKRLAITDISRKSDISREKLIDMMLDPEKGLEMLEIDGDFITVKQLPKQGIAAVPTTEIKGTPFRAESDEISQNQELQILREFEYISGQVRFKVGVINQSPGVLTNIKIDFTIPDALKWITYEPISYKRKGDSVIIPKLSLKEKKSINLYLEPISCMSGPINAIVSYFNALDEPRAITMRPKVIGITCPIFFTEEEANLARVESLNRQLSHKDKKILPIHKGQDYQKIFNLLLKVGGSHQIKLVSKEFSAENKYGKILYYGLTKVKKQKMVIVFLLRGGKQTIEVEIAGDNEETITALLAEIENQLRVIFTKEKVIKSGDKFHEMKTSVILGYCPFCGANFDSAQQEEFIKGNSITCEYCDKVINLN